MQAEQKQRPREELRIAIVGAGAIGCRIAAHLATQGTSTTLFDSWEEHVVALNRNGLTFDDLSTSKTIPVQAFHYSELPSQSFDNVFLAVRSDQTAAALPIVVALLAEDGYVVSAQNGLNEDAIAEAVGAHRTLGCSLVLGARLLGPGHVQALKGPDTLKIGELNGSTTPRLEQLTQLLSACGTAHITDNLLGYRWMKLVLNSIGNPLLLLSGQTAEVLHADEAARRVMIALTREVLSTAKLAGIQPEPILERSAEQWLADGALDDPDLHSQLMMHGQLLGPRRLSMVADFEARGRTEVEHINGYVIRKAAQHHRAAPLNTEVVRLVKALEAKEITPHPEALRSLKDAITG